MRKNNHKLAYLFLVFFFSFCSQQKELNLNVSIGGHRLIFNTPMFYIDGADYTSYVQISEWLILKNSSSDTILLDTIYNISSTVKSKDTSLTFFSVNNELGKRLVIYPNDSILLTLITDTLFSIKYNPHGIDKEIFDKVDKFIKKSSADLKFTYSCLGIKKTMIKKNIKKIKGYTWY